MKEETYPELEDGEQFFIGGPKLYKIPLSLEEMRGIIILLESFSCHCELGETRDTCVGILKKFAHYHIEISREDNRPSMKMPETDFPVMDGN